MLLARLAMVEQPAGLTDPDPDTPEERWDAAQVWAHIAEFVGYWHRQMADVIGRYQGEPVPFGRTKADAGRIGAIETGRHRPVKDLAADADREIVDLDRYLEVTRDERMAGARTAPHPRRNGCAADGRALHYRPSG